MKNFPRQEAPLARIGISIRIHSIFLYLSDSDGDVCTVRISDTGSKPQCTQVMIQGVPVDGIIDTAADITIMGGSLFQKVANVVRSMKKNFKTPNITPHCYD